MVFKAKICNKNITVKSSLVEQLKGEGETKRGFDFIPSLTVFFVNPSLNF